MRDCGDKDKSCPEAERAHRHGGAKERVRAILAGALATDPVELPSATLDSGVAAQVREMLVRVLHDMGGVMESEHESGLPGWIGGEQDTLRAAIRPLDRAAAA